MAAGAAQAPFARKYPPEWREQVFAQTFANLEANDRRADALLFLLREADAAELRDCLEQRAIHWRKKKAYETALCTCGSSSAIRRAVSRSVWSWLCAA